MLDGVLYHESDLDLEEHYTDTHGYTEINFAAFGMVGMRFCPRIRSLHRQRIYCADPGRDHGVLEPVLKRGRRAVNFRLIAEQWDRIGQFYAAFPAGHATASAALQRLNRFQASNRFYAANRELGRALKTEFVLQYMSEPQLRAKVRRGLLKVEQLHALARAVYYGQRGRISAREVYDQVNACSCLTLILACIVYWQAREISRMAAAPDFPFDPDLLRHVSPIEWKNVVLYGEIKIDPAKLKMRRPSTRASGVSMARATASRVQDGLDSPLERPLDRGEATRAEARADRREVRPARGAAEIYGLSGIWSGTGIQDGSSWTVEVALGDQGASSRYPTLQCGGELDPISVSATRLEYWERITFWLSRCVSGGRVLLERTSEEELRYTWYSGTLLATENLTRRRAE